MDNNLNFSQRMGLTPPIKLIQIDSINKDLMNGLWNVFQILILDELKPLSTGVFQDNLSNFQTQYFQRIWSSIFKLPVNEMRYTFWDVSEQVRKYYFDENRKWYEIYDFIETSTILFSQVKNGFGLNIDSSIVALINDYNKILELEFSAYRFIDGKLAPITNPIEIEGITNALDGTGKFDVFQGSNYYLANSLKLLSQKQNPQYSNSVKDSISAVESICKVIAESSDNDILSSALQKLYNKKIISENLFHGFRNLYSHTSKVDRHGSKVIPDSDFDDAKYMLVSCSAFINYLIAKSVKAGINFN